jgi:hypothetical protein
MVGVTGIEPVTPTMSTYSAALKVGKCKAFANPAKAFGAPMFPMRPGLVVQRTKGNYVTLEAARKAAKENERDG